MYKNFNLTDQERKQIMEMHSSHGYKKPVNELGQKEIDLIRGNTNFNFKTGRPPADGYDKDELAAKQFQRDFKKDFPDPSAETTPFWEKDKAEPSGDYKYVEAPKDGLREYELDMKITYYQDLIQSHENTIGKLRNKHIRYADKLPKWEVNYDQNAIDDLNKRIKKYELVIQKFEEMKSGLS